MPFRDCVRAAIAHQKIDMKEVDREILGTKHEKKAPNADRDKDDNKKQ